MSIMYCIFHRLELITGITTLNDIARYLHNHRSRTIHMINPNTGAINLLDALSPGKDLNRSSRLKSWDSSVISRLHKFRWFRHLH